MSYLTFDFTSSHRADSQLARQQEWFIKARRDQYKREAIADKKEETTSSLGGEVIIASEIQLREFKLKLDVYEAATTAALMANQKQLDVVSAQIDLLIAQAFVMPDGRRVFRTEDGSQVFDEHGTEVLPEELEFSAIPDDAPSWEVFSQQLSVQTRLNMERGQLIEYQENLDDARERSSDNELTVDELAELEIDLSSSMPLAVRRELPSLETATPLPAMAEQFSVKAQVSEQVFKSTDVELNELLPN